MSDFEFNAARNPVVEPGEKPSPDRTVEILVTSKIVLPASVRTAFPLADADAQSHIRFEAAKRTEFPKR